MAFALVFRFSELAQQAHTVGIPGIFEYYEVLTGITLPDEGFVLRPTKHSDGEYTVEGFYPPEWPKPNLESEASSA